MREVTTAKAAPIIRPAIPPIPIPPDWPSGRPAGQARPASILCHRLRPRR